MWVVITIYTNPDTKKTIYGPYNNRSTAVRKQMEIEGRALDEGYNAHLLTSVHKVINIDEMNAEMNNG